VGILQVLADVFQAELRPLSVANSSALGGALRAAQAVEGCAWDDLYQRFSAPDGDLCVQPSPAARAAYEELADKFRDRMALLVGH
jgi:sugar (pentulose or hexulose) kinase